MAHSFASLEYRRAATQQASVVGLVIALHDTLVGNLKRAADAMEKNDIATRCNELIHGFKVLAQLDAMLDMKSGGQAAINIRRFYKRLHTQMLEAQFKLSPDILHVQVDAILIVRQAWQQVDSSPVEAPAASNRAYASAPIQSSPESGVRTDFSCSG
jgi:flagellar protein FliS